MIARHLVHAPVAGLAGDALLDVDAVVEVDEVWQVVDPLPDQRLAGLEARSGRAPGCRSGSRPARGSSCRSRYDGIPANGDGLRRWCGSSAVDAIVADVVLVAERDRLVDGTSWLVTYGERTNRNTTPNSASGPAMAESKVTRAIALAPRGKTCAIGRRAPRLGYGGVSGRLAEHAA